MVNPAVAASTQNFRPNVQAMVQQTFDARQEELRGPASRDGIDAAQSNSWKSDDVGYYTPDAPASEHVRTARGTTYYPNVREDGILVRNFVGLLEADFRKDFRGRSALGEWQTGKYIEA